MTPTSSSAGSDSDWIDPALARSRANHPAGTGLLAAAIGPAVSRTLDRLVRPQYDDASVTDLFTRVTAAPPVTARQQFEDTVHAALADLAAAMVTLFERTEK